MEKVKKMKNKYRNKTENTKQNKPNIIPAFFMIFFIFLMILSSVKIFSWIKENIESKKITMNLKEAITVDENIDKVDKYSIDFNNLKQKNSETVAWIKVNGTNIEYPVVKTTNNDYYMTHSFDKTSNSAGWVFMDYKNKFDGTDKNIVVYAHNRRDGSLFGTLKNVLLKDWQSNEENFEIPFITENGKTQYKVFSVYKIEKEDYYITTNFKSDAEFETFIDIIKARSEKDFGVDVKSDNQILTLSTCANDNNYRVVLHAIKEN